MDFSRVAPCLGRSRISAKCGGKFYRREVLLRKFCGHRRNQVVEEHFGKGCRRSEIVGGEVL